jgi:hypothetical protein
MSRRRVVLWALVAVAYLATAAPNAQAWSNGGYSADQYDPDYGTHDWIADRALELQTQDVTFLESTYHTRFLLGTEAPDNPDYIGDTTNHHVYFYSTGDLQDDVCAVRASTVYNTALGYMADGDFEEAAYDIGVLAHYVADPGVFGHTMGAYTDWGAEVHHSDYEDEFESMLGSLAEPTGVVLEDLDAYNATLGLGETITFGDGAIQPNVWMDTNYDWSDDTFAASAIESLHASVGAVAAVINHFMIEAAASASVPTPEAPEPPTSFTAAVDGTHVVLTWAAPLSNGGADITRYLIFRGTDPGTPSQLADVPANARTWTDESVERGTTYYYWLVAENSVGRSDMTSLASARVPESIDTVMLYIVASAVSAALASGGTLYWRKRKRGKQLR